MCPLGAYSVRNPLGLGVKLMVDVGKTCLERSSYKGPGDVKPRVEWKVKSHIEEKAVQLTWGIARELFFKPRGINTDHVIAPSAEDNSAEVVRQFIESVQPLARGVFDPSFSELLERGLTREHVLAHNFECARLAFAREMGFVSPEPGDSIIEIVSRILKPGRTPPSMLMLRLSEKTFQQR